MSKHSKLVEEFERSYQALVKAICNNQKDDARKAYCDWLKARDNCQQIVLECVETGEIGSFKKIDGYVRVAFESLNGSYDDLLNKYGEFVLARDSAVKHFCPPDIIEELIIATTIKLPIIPGIAIDLKKLLGLKS